MSLVAKVVADSMSSAGIRLTTMELMYPRFIHDELLTHRQFSRNASSQRAIPVEKMVEAVEIDPAMPVRWGLNGKGMQDHGVLSPIGVEIAKKDWLLARDHAVAVARQMLARKEPAHKQIINRILSPFSHIHVLVTATEWENYFALRKHPDADPTFHALAIKMWEAWQASTPSLRGHGDWHLPYIEREDVDAALLYVMDQNETAQSVDQLAMTIEELDAKTTAACCRISAARCSRVSYVNHEKKRPTVAEDLAQFSRLMERMPMHASPAEHQATPDRLVPFANMVGWEQQHLHGNFVGWKQFRKFFVGEAVQTNFNAGIGTRQQIIKMEKQLGQNRSLV